MDRETLRMGFLPGTVVSGFIGTFEDDNVS